MKSVLLFSLLQAACVLSLSAQFRVVVIGSSTAGGTGAKPADSAWVPLFNQYYKHKLGIVDSTYTLAIGGYPVYKGMPTSYAPPSNRPGPDTGRNVSKANRVLANLPLMANGIVLVNYPTNGFESYNIGEIMRCLQVIYDSVTQQGHRCYIITSQPRTGGPFDASDTKRKLAVIKDSILQRFGEASTINFYDGIYDPSDSSILKKYSSGDGIHFNNAGHRELFERVKAKHILDHPAPLTLSNFKAVLQADGVLLLWSTEIADSASYIIQRSFNGVDFTNLHQSFSTGNQYQALDAAPAPGKNYYRLQIRKGNADFLSNTIHIRNPVPGVLLTSLHPEPAVEPILVAELTAMQDYDATVSITSISGLSFLQKETHFKKGNQQLWLPVDFLPGGQYILSIRYGQDQSILRSFSK